MLDRPQRYACLTLLLAATAAAQAPRQQAAPGAPMAPAGFRLDQIQQAYLDQVLTQWETQSGQIETFRCDFTRLEYDNVFGPGVNKETNQQRHKTEGRGTVSYQRPDKGSFHVKELKSWDAANGQYVENPNLIGEHWVCDGQSVFQYEYSQKQLKESPIPPELQGKNIADGPLPFLFGAEAAKIKRRYWLRVDPRAQAGTVWLTAAPKTRADAANYRQVDIMLDAKRMLPYAMRVTAPDNSQTTYTFELAGAKINESGIAAMWRQLFSAPKTPWGWKRVVEAPPTASTAAQPAAPRR